MMFGQDAQRKGIHQIELEHHKIYYLESTHKPGSTPPIPLKKRVDGPSKIVFGYHPYWSGSKWQNYNYDLLTTIAYFSAEANANGDLTDLHGWPKTDLINKAHENGVEVVLVVTLFNKSDLETLLSNSDNRNRLINNLVTQVENGNADGVNIDFEAFPPSQKSNLVTFVKDLRKALRDKISHAKVTLATPAVDWNSAWDFNALAKESDGLFIMGYDYHWKGSSTTGPVSPLKDGSYNITKTVNTYLSATGNNAEKIILGLPYYGYEWTANSGNKGANTTASGTAVIYANAENNAKSYGRIWDDASETPWYKYENNGWYQTWYDDSLSLAKKYDLALSKDLGGVGMWALGYDEGSQKLWQSLKDKMSAKTAPSTPVNLNITNLGNGVVTIDFTGSPVATGYSVIRVYPLSSKEDDLGSFTSTPILLSGLTLDSTYYFTIKASNDIGSSGATEVLGVTPSSNMPKILIINGFDRVSGTTNTYDFIKQHGDAIHKNGYTFDSASNEAIINGRVKLTDYAIIDWILGEEGSSTSSFDETEQSLLKEFMKKGGRLFVSGSEIGYDLVEQGSVSDNLFFEKFLKAEYISDAAAGKQGTYSVTGVSGSIFENMTITFDDGTHGTYDVDWPDGIKPTSDASILLHYENAEYDQKGGAGIAYTGGLDGSLFTGGLVYLSIGFETIYPDNSRKTIMGNILSYLDGTTASVRDEENIIPKSLNIISLYPNPSNQSITIEFRVEQFSPIAYLSITDLMGREVYKMSVQPLAAKTQKFSWHGRLHNGQDAPTGIYLAKLSQGSQLITKKFTLLK